MFSCRDILRQGIRVVIFQPQHSSQGIQHEKDILFNRVRTDGRGPDVHRRAGKGERPVLHLYGGDRSSSPVVLSRPGQREMAERLLVGYQPQYAGIIYDNADAPYMSGMHATESPGQSPAGHAKQLRHMGWAGYLCLPSVRNHAMYSASLHISGCKQLLGGKSQLSLSMS